MEAHFLSSLRKEYDALRDLVPFVQFKKREKHPWRSLTFRLKLTLLHGCCSRFLNCINGTKPRKASHLINDEHIFLTLTVLPFSEVISKYYLIKWSYDHMTPWNQNTYLNITENLKNYLVSFLQLATINWFTETIWNISTFL